MRIVLSFIIGMITSAPALADRVMIPWTAGDSAAEIMPWAVVNAAEMNGWTKNFKNDTVEEHRQVAPTGELEAEIITPKATTGPIPFVLLLHGCSGMEPLLRTWAHDMAGRLAEIGYGSLILDSFKTRGVSNICSDPSQLDWARRRADDAYSALDYLIAKGLAIPNKVFVIGRSNGATTTLLIMNSKIGVLHKNKFSGAFPMQPSCRYLIDAEFYAPVQLFLAEKDEATSPVLCKAMADSPRSIPVKYVIFKGAHHAFEDHVPVHVFQGYHVGYNAAAAQGTINGILAALKNER